MAADVACVLALSRGQWSGSAREHYRSTGTIARNKRRRSLFAAEGLDRSSLTVTSLVLSSGPLLSRIAHFSEKKRCWGFLRQHALPLTAAQKKVNVYMYQTT
ncbi:hypothetical protein SRHO_G00172700 [Serrasalmus rhombeus]